MTETPSAASVFEERLTGPFAPEVYATPLPMIAAAVCLAFLWSIAAALPLALGLFAALFFRNPTREIPGDERALVAPADGRVVAVGEWLTRGVRYGMIRFGSRTGVALPLGSEARVAVRDRVSGGSSVIAVLGGGPE